MHNSSLAINSRPTDELQGILKQQCLDESGLFEWVQKKFTLHPSKGILEIDDLNKSIPIINVPLAGAKYAKEWSITSNIAGFGFDLIWHSGKIWSFLVDNEHSCKTWVNRFNYTFSLISTTGNIDIQTEESKHIVLGASLTHRVESAADNQLNSSLFRDNFDSDSLQLKIANTIHKSLDTTKINNYTPHDNPTYVDDTLREVRSIQSHTPISTSSSSTSANVRETDVHSIMRAATDKDDLNIDRKDFKVIKESWDAKKDEIEKSHAREMQRLFESEKNASERMHVAEREEFELRNKLSHITAQFENLSLEYSRLCSEQKSELDSVYRSRELALIEEKSRLQNEMSDSLSKLRERNVQEQEEVRRREKEVFDKELKKLKSHYEQRENDTSEDLMRLERLHADRVRELENELKQWRSRAEHTELQEIDWNRRLQDVIKDHERQLEVHSNNAYVVKEVRHNHFFQSTCVYFDMYLVHFLLIYICICVCICICIYI